MKNNIISLKPFLDILQDAERNREEYLAEREEEARIADEQQEQWESYLAARGWEDAGLIEVDDGYRYFDPEDVDHVMQAFDRLVQQQREEQIEALEALEVIRGLIAGLPQDQETSGQAAEREEQNLQVRDPSIDEPLSLFEAACLPELGGRLFVGSDVPGRPGSTAVKTLRAEIAAGRLLRVPPFNKNRRVSRRTIKEWLELRQDDTAAGRKSSEDPHNQNTIHDIRKRQKATRSSLATERAEKSMSAVEAARLRIQQGRQQLKR